MVHQLTSILNARGSHRTSFEPAQHPLVARRTCLTRVHESDDSMVDIPVRIQAFSLEERARIQRSRPSGRLSADVIVSIDRAVGGPGEGRGYYVYAEGTEAERFLKLKGDVAVRCSECRRKGKPESTRHPDAQRRATTTSGLPGRKGRLVPAPNAAWHGTRMLGSRRACTSKEEHHGFR